jgi:threonine dehydrogenase-like Zn-dependent dehydrogenase
MKACGVCGNDPHLAREGGRPPLEGRMPLGHEPAGEIVEVGGDVSGLSVGDHVVLNPIIGSSIMGVGDPQGGLSEFVAVRDARRGTNLQVVPEHIPWATLALNEPMAVARHAVNRTRPKRGDKVVVFGAGPIGLGALLSYKLAGVEHVVVVDLQRRRLHKALRLGADAVVNSAEEDLTDRLRELHGTADGPFRRGSRPATSVYLDAAGAPAIVRTVLDTAAYGSTFGVVATHKQPVELDLAAMLSVEMDLVTSRAYPNEIFEVTEHLTAEWETYAQIVSDVVPLSEAQRAIELASSPGSTDKVVVSIP